MGKAWRTKKGKCLVSGGGTRGSLRPFELEIFADRWLLNRVVWRGSLCQTDASFG